MRPSKRLGQNFVIEAGTVRKIAALAALGPDDVVLEVGPGLGSLTLALLEAGPGVIAVEVDPVLAAELPRTVASRAPDLAGRLAALAADALTVTEADLARPVGRPPSALVANLPYNVAVPVVLHLLAAVPALARGLVMVQAEVADRLCAVPGTRVYGALSVKLAWYAAARSAGTVSRSVFWPVPNVDSKLVAFTRHNPPATSASREEVFAVVNAAFGQRRKTLRAALAGWPARRRRRSGCFGRPASIRVREGNRSAWRSSPAWPPCARPVRSVHRDRCDGAGARQTQPPARGGSAARRRLSQPRDGVPRRLAVRSGHGGTGRT